MALDEFVDEFYLNHPDKGAQQMRLDPVPEPVRDPLIDARGSERARSTSFSVGGYGHQHGHDGRNTSR